MSGRHVPDRAEIEKRIGWHINCLAQFLQEVRDEADVAGVLLHLTLIQGGARVVRLMDVRVAPNLPGITKLEKELGLRPEDGRQGSEPGR